MNNHVLNKLQMMGIWMDIFSCYNLERGPPFVLRKFYPRFFILDENKFVEYIPLIPQHEEDVGSWYKSAETETQA